MKELAFYNKFNNLEPLFIEQQVENTNVSVQGLMLNFLKDLQVDFPATISTILKIGDKIVTNEADTCCRLCKVQKVIVNEKNLIIWISEFYTIGKSTIMFR